jgi:SAM-dependent methyltransferase
MKRLASKPERFDAAYYRRFYGAKASRVSSQQAIDRLATFVCGYLDYLEQPVRRVLDVGCGLGHWRTPIATHYPRAKYVGMEFSAHLCEQHGWLQGSISERVPRGGFDLVICQGVLQYIGDRDLPAALDNLATACRGVLYLEALTLEDWRQNVDQKRTDSAVHLRAAKRYRDGLRRRGFITAGGGVFVSERSPVVLFELEKG